MRKNTPQKFSKPSTQSERKIKAIAVFCGTAPGHSPTYVRAASELGAQIASRGYTLVYGGGNTGMMGAVAAAALEHKGHVIGIIPRLLVAREVTHRAISELRVVHDMHERKKAMMETADAFIAMPGGLGTLEELLEVWSWGQMALHSKPIGLLNVDGYFDQLLRFFEHAENQGFVHADARQILVADDSPQHLLRRLEEQEAR